MNIDKELSSAEARFPSTSWMLVTRRHDQQALERLISKYWKPVYWFIRRKWNRGDEDAKDLTQEFFLTNILEGALLDKFAPERGSFRSLLKAAVSNFVRNAARNERRQKRSGSALLLRLEGFEGGLSELLPDPRGLTPEQLFDKAWKSIVLHQAMKRVELKFLTQKKSDYVELFRNYYFKPGTSYKSLSATTGLGIEVIKKHLSRVRREFMQAVTEVITDYVDNLQDLTTEMRELFGRGFK